MLLVTKCNSMYALTNEVLSKRLQGYTQEHADKCCLFSTRPSAREYTRGLSYLGPSEAKAYICYDCSHCSLFCHPRAYYLRKFNGFPTVGFFYSTIQHILLR